MMKRILWNDGWRLQKGGTFFDAFGGNEKGSLPITLPYDPLIRAPRKLDGVNGPAAGFYDGGTYLYLKQFTLDPALKGTPVMVEFEGVMGSAMVYLNEQFIGSCHNGYTGFSVSLNPYLRWDRPNTLKVVSKTGMQQIARWYTGAGIYRDVYLRCSGTDAAIADDGVQVTTETIDGSEAILRVDTEVSSLALPGTLRTLTIVTRIFDPNGVEVASDRAPITLIPEDGKKTVRQRMLIDNICLWDLDNPQLYTAKVSLFEGDALLDRDAVSFGVRTLTIDARHGLRLNGKTLKLRGGCIHHDSGLLGAATYPEYETRRVRILKDAGFNAIRSSHNAISRPLLDACDKLGMLVMDEGFDIWNTGKTDHDYSLHFADRWEEDLTAMVRKDYNHPSVFTYSIGNEIPDTGSPDGWRQGRKMVELLHRLDPTRPVCNCINAMFSVMDRMGGIIEDVLGKEAIARNQESEVNSLMLAFATRMDDIMRHPVVDAAIEESFTEVDLCGYNYMDMRYTSDHERYPNRVIVGSETNALRIARNWQLILDSPHVIGDFCWTAIDYIGEAQLSADGEETFASYCGDIDLTGHRKPKSYYREIVWGLKKGPAIFVGRPEKYGKDEHLGNWGWTDAIDSWTLPGHEGDPVTVNVYADADRIALYLNGTLLEEKVTGDPYAFIARFDVIYQPGELMAVAYKDGVEIGRNTLHTAGDAVSVCLSAEPYAEGDQLLFVHLDITDGSGALVTASDRKITVQVEGGELLALGSGAVSSHENYYDPSHTTMDGRLLAIIRRSGGVVTVTAEADGLTSGSLTIN